MVEFSTCPEPIQERGQPGKQGGRDKSSPYILLSYFHPWGWKPWWVLSQRCSPWRTPVCTEHEV